MPRVSDQEVNAAHDALSQARTAALAATAAAQKATADRSELNADSAAASAGAARVAAVAAGQQAAIVKARLDDINKDLQDAKDAGAEKNKAVEKLKQLIEEKKRAAELLPGKQRNALENSDQEKKNARQVQSNLPVMKAKLAKLKEESESGEKLVQATRAVAQAKKDFDDKETAAAEACTGRWFPGWRADPKEVGERNEAEAVLAEKSKQYEEIKSKKEEEYAAYAGKVDAAETKMSGHEAEALKYAREAAEYERQRLELEKALRELEQELSQTKQHAAVLKAKAETLEALAAFNANSPITAARAAAVAADQRAIAAYDALAVLPGDPARTIRVVGRRADLSVANGAIFNTSAGGNHDPNSLAGRALAAYQHDPPQTGQTAKTLAGVLASKNQANFVAHMDAEVAAGRCLRTEVKANGNRKYEYPDGTMVRYKAVATAFRPPPTYSVEVKHTPANPDMGPNDVAFKVDQKGNAVPKNPPDVNNPYGHAGARAAYNDHLMSVGHLSIPV